MDWEEKDKINMIKWKKNIQENKKKSSEKKEKVTRDTEDNKQGKYKTKYIKSKNMWRINSSTSGDRQKSSPENKNQKEIKKKSYKKWRQSKINEDMKCRTKK